MQKRYEDLLGVCSHELYHTWNIKAIRPIEMLPYDFTKENYFLTRTTVLSVAQNNFEFLMIKTPPSTVYESSFLLGRT